MSDRRELILLRLVAILEIVKASTPPTIKTVDRNKDYRKDIDRPALILLDGDEVAESTVERSRGRATGMVPQIMRMSPQVFILMNEQRPGNVEIGPETNAIRMKIINAVASDAELVALYGANGSIVLNATTTDMKSGGDVSGSMLLDFRINYPLIPNS